MRLHEMSIYDTLFKWRLCLEAPQMRMTTDTTARMAVLTLCVAIVIMRLLRPEIAFDAHRWERWRLAALIAIAPVLRERSRDGQAEAGEPAPVAHGERTQTEHIGRGTVAGRVRAAHTPR